MAIHVDPSAVVDPKAVLDNDVSIGPYCVIGPGVFIGSGTRLLNHVTVMGDVRIGHDNIFYPNCVIGAEPQDLGYRGEPTWVVIGDRNTFREGCTVHRATTKDLGVTRIGNDNYFMSMVHIAHDCLVGNKIIIANMTQLSGHAKVEDFAVLSGMVGIHHFATIGRYSFIGGMSAIRTDVAPFMLYEGWPAEPTKVNIIGLRRNGFSHADINSLTECHRIIWRRGLAFDQAKAEIESMVAMTAPVQELLAFLERQRSGKKGRAREGRRAA